MSTSHISLVINTGPIIALAAGVSHPEVVLRHFHRVLVPREVVREIRAGSTAAVGQNILDLGSPIEISHSDVNVRKDLVLALDRGEASVIQTALEKQIALVCIDEAIGRRVARLNGLSVTGSLGLIIHAIHRGEAIDIASTINTMRANGIWLSEQLERQAIKLAKR
ncbi:MAG: DUF3368 domain-containing protein [Spirochaetaceae bacterium]|nr:MAG: DUF3368 domain-containing protein [Spirochaetaceae bacterium]